MPLRAIRNFRSASADKLSACWARQGEFAEAAFWQEESIWLEPDRAVSWSLLGLYLMRLGDSTNSQMALAEAEFLDEQVLRTEMVRTMQALSMGDVDLVDEQLRVLRDMPAPGSIVADELEARLELDLGNVAEAAEQQRDGLAQQRRGVWGVCASQLATLLSVSAGVRGQEGERLQGREARASGEGERA